LLSDDEAADVQVVEADDAFGRALVAVGYLPGAAFNFFPGGGLLGVEEAVSPIFDIVGEEGALHPCIGGSSVEVQLDELRRSADADFCKVQRVVFDVLGLILRSASLTSVSALSDLCETYRNCASMSSLCIPLHQLKLLGEDLSAVVCESALNV
jgi:hypothetical protein